MLTIQKQYLVEGGYCEWEDAFCFADNISGCNDLFDILSTYFQKAVGSEELFPVPHMWRVYDHETQEVIEVSGDVNIIQLSDFGSYDTCGIGEIPAWVEGEHRNVEQNNRIISELMKKGLLEDFDEEDDNE